MEDIIINGEPDNPKRPGDAGVCIDLSSSVETDGAKDYNKIKKIMECTEK